MVDAPGLGPDAGNGVGVQIPSLAPLYLSNKTIQRTLTNEAKKLILRKHCFLIKKKKNRIAFQFSVHSEFL